MKLFYADASPFARKVRIVAIELGLADQIHLETVKAVPGGEPNRELGAANPMRKIPALVTDDGAAIYDSTVICEYLDSLNTDVHLIPIQAALRANVMTAHALANGLMEIAVGLRYETFVRPEELRWQGIIDDHFDRIDTGLNWLEENGDVLEGDTDLAHIAIGCLLGYLDFRFADRPWREGRPKLTAWGETILSSASFVETKPK